MVVCIAYWRCLKGAIVRLMSCNEPLKASRLLWVYRLKIRLYTNRKLEHVCTQLLVTGLPRAVYACMLNLITRRASIRRH